MELTLNELEKWFKDQESIIKDITITIKNLYRIIEPKDQFEKEILKHGFFNQFYQQCWFTAVVQLSKLFSDSKNHKRSFMKFFAVLKGNELDSVLTVCFTQNNNSFGKVFKSKQDMLDEILIWESKIEQHKEIIEIICYLRDKTYAHRDSDYVQPQISVLDLEKLSFLAQGCYNAFRGGILNKYFLFHINNDWSIDYPMRMLGLQLKANKSLKSVM